MFLLGRCLFITPFLFVSLGAMVIPQSSLAADRLAQMETRSVVVSRFGSKGWLIALQPARLQARGKRSGQALEALEKARREERLEIPLAQIESEIRVAKAEQLALEKERDAYRPFSVWVNQNGIFESSERFVQVRIAEIRERIASLERARLQLNYDESLRQALSP